MLWYMVVAMVALWLFGVASGNTMDGDIHLLLVCASVALVIRESLKDDVLAVTGTRKPGRKKWSGEKAGEKQAG